MNNDSITHKVSLHYWYIDIANADLIAHGIVTGHDSFFDGSRIHTSRVKSAVFDPKTEEMIITTKNTIYHCPMNYCDFTKQDKHPELIENYEELRSQYINKIDLPEIENGNMLLVLSDFDEYHFHSICAKIKDGTKLEYDAGAHLGMFCDSFIIHIEDGSSIRYFMKRGGISIYICNNYNMPLYVENIGSYEIPVDIDKQYNCFNHGNTRYIHKKIILKPGERKLFIREIQRTPPKNRTPQETSFETVTTDDGFVIRGHELLQYKGNDTRIIIPDDVWKIGSEVFIEPDNNKSEDHTLEYIDLNHVREIGFKAFQCCKALKTVIMSEELESLEDYVFSGCESLEEIEFPDSVKSMGKDTFFGCFNLKRVKLPSKIECIPKQTFLCCESLESCSIPESVISIGDAAFHDCKSLRSIEILENVSHIGYWAFVECEKLENITIRSNVLDIDEHAFGRSNNISTISLTTINISSEVKSISKNMFVSCEKLTSIAVSPDNDSFTSIDGVLYDKSVTRLICYPADKHGSIYVIPETVTKISGGAFYGCKNLTDVVIPEGVTVIGTDSFRNCENLENITIPDAVTKIRKSAFKGCRNLVSSKLPDNKDFKEISESLFSGCEKLINVNVPDSVRRIGKEAFRDCRSLDEITREKVMPLIEHELDEMLIRNKVEPFVPGMNMLRVFDFTPSDAPDEERDFDEDSYYSLTADNERGSLLRAILSGLEGIGIHSLTEIVTKEWSIVDMKCISLLSKTWINLFAQPNKLHYICCGPDIKTFMRDIKDFCDLDESFEFKSTFDYYFILVTNLHGKITETVMTAESINEWLRMRSIPPFEGGLVEISMRYKH